jgi:hypothetical protein
MLPLARRTMLPLGRRVALPKLGAPAVRRAVPLLVRGVARFDRATLATGPSAAQLPRPVDTAWDSLSDTQQSAAMVLGWTPETWGDGMHLPPLSAGLSDEQKLAVRELGYTSVDTEEVDTPRLDTDWSGDSSEQADPGSTGTTSGLRGVALRLLAAILTGAALCVGADTAGLLPDGHEAPTPAATDAD